MGIVFLCFIGIQSSIPRDFTFAPQSLFGINRGTKRNTITRSKKLHLCKHWQCSKMLGRKSKYLQPRFPRGMLGLDFLVKICCFTTHFSPLAFNTILEQCSDLITSLTMYNPSTWTSIFFGSPTLFQLLILESICRVKTVVTNIFD